MSLATFGLVLFIVVVVVDLLALALDAVLDIMRLMLITTWLIQQRWRVNAAIGWQLLGALGLAIHLLVR